MAEGSIFLTGKPAVFFHIEKDPAGKNSIISNYVINLFEDSRGNLWIGTYDGFSIMDKERKHFKNYHNVPNKNSLSGDWVYCIYEDKKGRIWIGTNFGLNLFDPASEKFIIFSKKNGFPGNEIMGIMEDANGHLWVSTNKGILQFNPENYKFNIFDASDGLSGNQFNHGSFFKASDGTMFFGGSSGITYFHPELIQINKSIPPVYITELECPSKKIALNKPEETEKGLFYSEIELPFRLASVITLKYTALNFINSQKNQYLYQLEGFDNEWHDAGNSQIASYTYLNPGIYKFKVIASNNNGVWNNKGATLLIRIKPPLYRSPVAYVFYFILFIILVYFVFHFILGRIRYKRELALEHFKLEKTREMSRMKTEFFLNVSHELSTPLTLILVPLQQLFDHSVFDHSLVQTALKNAKRLLKLVGELLDFQKLEEGKINLLISRNELNTFIKEIIENFREAFKRKDVSLSFTTDTPVIEMGFDTEKMEKIMYNLISNAYKYTNPGGKVEVSVRLGNESDTPGFVYISVTDNGIGIRNEKLSNIFEKYYRVGENTSETRLIKSTGYGIGLYTTKMLVELHGGEITAESREGKGSSFIVKIPFLNKAGDPPENDFITPEHQPVEEEENIPLYEEDDEEGYTGKKNRDSRPVILIIEDNTELMGVLEKLLSEKYRIIKSYNGNDGLKLASKYFPDLIITDVMMPEMDGMEVCSTLKNNIFTSHIPIIILTALHTNDYRLKGYMTGADDYISKPFNSKILETRIYNLIESRKALQKKYVRDIRVQPGEITVTSADEKFINDAVKIVEENIENSEFSVVDLAQNMNMSEATLYRKIKALTSQSPNLFIRTIRLKRAAQYLENTNFSVTEIVFKVGLSDVKYFRKCFQKQFGMNPAEYGKKK